MELLRCGNISQATGRFSHAYDEIEEGCKAFLAEVIRNRGMRLDVREFKGRCADKGNPEIGVFNLHTPCIPPSLIRYLYHFVGTDTPKDTDIDTMSVFFLFAVSSVEDANIG